MMTDLVVVEVELTDGQRYVFPDVAVAMLNTVLRLMSWPKVDNVVLVNVQGACLSIPKHPIIRITAGSEEVWCASPA